MKVKVRHSRAKSKGIVILRDTRETRPIEFQREEMIAGVKKQTLQVGDYQAQFPDGSKSKIVFERKSVADLWGTMTKGHNRFMNEFERSKKLRLELVLIVEASFSSILTGFDRSRYPGTAMAKKLWTLHHEYGIRSVYCRSREDMSNYIAWAFIGEMLFRERRVKA